MTSSQVVDLIPGARFRDTSKFRGGDFFPARADWICERVMEDLGLGACLLSSLEVAIWAVCTGHCDAADFLLKEMAHFSSRFDYSDDVSTIPLREREIEPYLLALDLYWHEHPSRKPSNWSLSPHLEEELVAKITDSRRLFVLSVLTKPGTQNAKAISRQALLQSVVYESDDPDQLAKSACILASLGGGGAFPSQEDTESAFQLANKWAALSGHKSMSGHNPDFTNLLRADLAACCHDLALAQALLLEFITDTPEHFPNGMLAGSAICNLLAYPAFAIGKMGKFEIPYCDIADVAIRVGNAYKTRALLGRQDPLPGVSWKEIVDRLVEISWSVYEKDYTENGQQQRSDLTFRPATEQEIETLEERVGPLPADFKEFLGVTNGFMGGFGWLGGGINGAYAPGEVGNIDILGVNLIDARSSARRYQSLSFMGVKTTQRGAETPVYADVALIGPMRPLEDEDAVYTFFVPEYIFRNWPEFYPDAGPTRLVIQESAPEDTVKVYGSFRHYICTEMARLAERVETNTVQLF